MLQGMFLYFLKRTLLWAVLAAAIIALLAGWGLRGAVGRRDPGTPGMQAFAGAIQEGALAYLRQQLRAMFPFIVLVTLGLYFLYRPIYAEKPILSIGVAAAFLLGCFASAGAGCAGMPSAVRGSVRVASAARRSYREALEIA